MTDWKAISKKLIDVMLEQPFLASLFIVDFFLLLFMRPPFLFSLIMLSGLVALCMYWGQKLALFNLQK